MLDWPSRIETDDEETGDLMALRYWVGMFMRSGKCTKHSLFWHGYIVPANVTLDARIGES